jgi:hypothetical protein
MSGNKLSYGTTSNNCGYSFYYNAFPKSGVPVTESGVDALRNANFSLPDTTWSYGDEVGGTNRVLLDTLLKNITDDNGFGAVGQAIRFNNIEMYEVEHYEITNGVIKYISFYGDELVDDEYKGNMVKGCKVVADGSYEKRFAHFYGDTDVNGANYGS